MLQYRVLLRGSAFILWFLVAGSSTLAQEGLPSLIKKIQPSVVSITTFNEDGKPLSQGSGFFVSAAADVITNRHVLEGASRAEVKTSDGKSYFITGVVADDEDADLIRVSVNVPRRVAPLTVTRVLPEVGERVLVIGSPLGLEHTVSEGIVSAIRSIPAFGKIIQITAAISPGSSGSPVINMKGQVIGLATLQIVEGQSLNFALPGESISKMEPSEPKTLAQWSSEALRRQAKKETIPSRGAVETFYKGKTIRLIVGFAAGGGFDLYSRLIARHMGRHIPGNPTIFVDNMPGAGSIISANYLYKVAKPDGLTIGNFHGGLILQQLLDRAGIEFNARRFEYIGVPVTDYPVCALTRKSGITSIEKWMTANMPVRIGGIAAGSQFDNIPKILRAALGLPIQVVEGYKGTADILQAADRGNIAGGCWAWASVKATWRKAIESGEVVIPLQVTPRAHPELPGVPLAISFAKTDAARLMIQAGIEHPSAITRPYVFPPGTPKGRLQLLRNAFDVTLEDPQFVAEVQKYKIDIDPLTGEAVDEMVVDLFKLHPTIVGKLKEVLTR